MKILNKSLDLAKKLFPVHYKKTGSCRSYHFSFAFERNKLLSIGLNSYNLSNKAKYFADRYNVDSLQEWPTLHAEVDMLSKLWSNYQIGSRTKVVVLRLNRYGELCESHPCSSCTEILKAVGISELWYSSNGGIIEWV